MTRKMTGIGWVIALVAAGWAAPAEAQRGPGPGFQAGPNMGRSLELALENSEPMELTADQLSQLQELKTILDGEVLPLAEEMKNLREQIWAGDVPRAEGFRQMETLRGELITASAPLRGRVQEILTVAQHGRLQALVWQERPGRGRGAALGGMGAGRAGIAPMAGRGGVRGFQPGMGARGLQRPMRGIRGGVGPGWGGRGWGAGAPLPPGGGELLPSEGF